jgi:hypothetical protein
MLSIHLRLGLPTGLFLSGFPTNTYTPSSPPFVPHATLTTRPQRRSIPHAVLLTCKQEFITISHRSCVRNCNALIIRIHVFCLRHDVSDTGSCLRLQLEPTHLDPTDRTTFCLESLWQETETSFVYWAQLSSLHLQNLTSETSRSNNRQNHR